MDVITPNLPTLWVWIGLRALFRLFQILVWAETQKAHSHKCAGSIVFYFVQCQAWCQMNDAIVFLPMLVTHPSEHCPSKFPP